jgi:hypothetical protein
LSKFKWLIIFRDGQGAQLNTNTQQPGQPVIDQRRGGAAACAFVVGWSALLVAVGGAGTAAPPPVQTALAVPLSGPVQPMFPPLRTLEPLGPQAGVSPVAGAETMPVAVPASEAVAPAQAAPAMTMAQFLDRLMRAESGGRLTARNSRSTALGPFQFIDATFLSVARRHFGAETAALKPSQVLALRTNLDFSRRAAEAYTNDNAAILTGAGLPATFPNLRLAFLLGPGGAIKVLQADPATPLAKLLPLGVLHANPFMRTMTAASLAARTAREVGPSSTVVAVASKPLAPVVPVPAPSAPPVPVVPGEATPATSVVASVDAIDPVGAAAPAMAALATPKGAKRPTQRAKPSVVVKCDLGLPSCRRWLALEQRKLASVPGLVIQVSSQVQ